MTSSLGMREALRLFVLVCLLLSLTTAVAAETEGGDVYYCLEDYKPIGSLLRNVRVPAPGAADRTTPRTSGQVARACAAACNAAPECSGFRAVGPEVKGGSTCQLLANSTQSLPAALAFGPSTPWPKVNANLTAADQIALRSISWMCWRQQQDWDRFGAATHSMIVSGNTEGTALEDGHKDWCAFGVDVAGTNVRRDFLNITHPEQCDTICRENTTGCTMWIFVASRPEQVQFQPEKNCFAKADAFRGQNGWTGKPKSDIWIADSQVTCFSNLPDWRHLGLVLSPSIKTIQQDSSYFTVYPERVTWSEAAATCKQLPGGQLAILDSQALIDKVSRDLLDTLPFQTAVRSAWVGATGNNTAFNPAAATISDLAGNTSEGNGRLQARLPPRKELTTPPETTLRWTGGTQVAPGLLRRPDSLTQLWTVHDVVWSQQYVPESSKDVCGRVMVQLPPSTGPVNPASVLPGMWYYDCDKPAAFICQSSSAPTEPMSGREVTPSKVADSSDPGSSSDGGGGGMQPWKTALAVILPVLVVALLALQVFHIYSRKVSRLPEMIRQQRKRALGQPRTGRMSLVMTDIQGFTRLMESNADNTTQALLLHNSIIKHAVYQNVGWVVEQEGDSFSVVFHEAEDAVAFTLQVQQALLAHNWPRGVAYQDDWEGATSFLDCRSASQQPDDPALGAAAAEAGTPQHGDSFSWQVGDADAAVAAGTASQASSCSMGLAAAMRQQLLNLRPGGRSSSFTASGGSTCKPSAGHRRSHSQENGHGPDQQQQQTDLAERIDSTVSGVSSSSSARAARQASATPADSRSVWHHIRGHSPSSSQLAPSPPSFAGSAPPTGTGTAPLSPHSRKSVLGSRPRNLWLFQQLLGPRQEQQKLFSGLRVRMGVVTGTVERGQELKSSALYRSAQAVSNAAHGGQVLMDELTFSAVKEAMWRLGAVGPNGLDYDALLATKSARHSISGSNGGGSSCMGDGCLPSLTPGSSLRRDTSGLSTETSQLPAVGGSTLALALDMGCYEILTPSDPAYPGHVNSSGSSTKGAHGPLQGKHRGAVCVQLWTRELGERLVQQYQQYIQQQLSRQGALDLQDELGRDNSFDEEAPYMLHGRLGALQEHHQPLQQQHPHLGLGGLRQLSVGRSSSRSLGVSGGHVVEYGDRQLSASSRRQQQQQHSPRAGMMGRSASMTVPHSWQQMTSSLFGVGVMHPEGDTDGLTSSSNLKAGRHGPNLGFCSISAVLRRNVRLYQAVAPTLAGRAALFGQQLDLPGSWRVLDLPYFAAPGLSSASLLAAQEAALEAAASEQQAAGDPVLDRLRLPRVPGRFSSEGAPWQQQVGLAGRSSSEVHLAPDLQELQARMRASSANGAALVAAVDQAAAMPGPVLPAAALSPTAAGQRGDSAPPGLVGDAVGGVEDSSYLEPSGKPISQSSSSPFLPAAQHRLSGSETGSASLSDTIGAAAAAAAAAAPAPAPAPAGPQGSDSTQTVAGWTSTDRQQPTTPHLARLNSSSTHGGQLALSVLPQQRLAAPLSPPAAGSSQVTANQSLLMLRAASLQLNVSPSVLLASSDRRAVTGTGPRRLSGPARALFPPVTILFAAVEGSGELLRYPTLARSVHGMVHHLMLQLLHAFPGSYLVRAQQGDLKYMLAFTSPAAAVSWGLTLQEASLYLPYPQEVLGLGSFGVQLDEGGRLVFRGPRFKMGLSQGSPKAIMPDHLGRADYHGSFVNLASRYAAVAAQGGQLVTDAELARQVLWHWQACSFAAAGHSSNGNINSSQADTFGSFSGFSALRSQATGSDTSNVQQWASLLQQQGSLPAVQPPVAAAAAAGSDAAPNKSSSGITAPGSAAAGAAGSSSNGSSHVLVIQPSKGTLCVSAAGPEAGAAGGSSTGGAAAGAAAEVPVECCWLGSFLFKGNPSPVSMVNFSPAVLSGRHYAPPAMSSSKGVRVLQRVGVMDRAVVRLPAAVEGFGPWEHTAAE